MAEYVDVDKLAKKLRYIFNTYGVNKIIAKKVNEALNKSVADVVEVVRCKDCKHAEVCETQCGAKYIECLSHDVYMEADDFCSYGERKES